MRSRVALFALLSLLYCAHDVRAQSNWTANGGGDWSDPTRWDNGSPNGPAAHAIFGPTRPTMPSIVNLTAPVELTTLEFRNSQGVTLAGSGPLRFVAAPGSNAVLDYPSGNGLAISVPIQIDADALDVNVAANPLTFSGPIGGAGKLRKLGAGTLTLAGDTSTHLGETEIAAGTLIASVLAAGSDSGRFVVSDSGNLSILAGPSETTIRKPLYSDGRTISLTSVSANAIARVESPLEIHGSSTISISPNLRADLYGNISGPGGLSIVATGSAQNSVRVNVRGNNSYEGVTIVDVGPRSTGRQAIVFTATGLGSTAGHTIVRSRLALEEGMAEDFVVETTGQLFFTPSGTPYSGNVTLMSAILMPTYQFLGEGDVAVEMSGNIELQGGGQIGETPYTTNPLNMSGIITGTGSLVFEGGGPQRFLGGVGIDGDLIVGSRGYVELIGEVAIAGDLHVTSDRGIEPFGGLAFWRSNASDFAGDVYLRRSLLTVAADMDLDDLVLDPRGASRPTSQQSASLVVNDGVELNVRGELTFRGGEIDGPVQGVEDYHKRTIVNGSLSRLGVDFHGGVFVHEGLLSVKDSAGLGAADGGAHVMSADRAVLSINATVNDDIYLNNGRGFNYYGALVGSGTVAGDVFLGDEGAYLGGGYNDNIGFPGQHGADLTFAGQIHGGRLVKGARGRVTIVSGDHTYSGRTEILGGEFILKDQGRLNSTSEIVLRPTDHTTEFQLDDRGQLSTDRVADSINWRSIGGNRIHLLGRSGSATSETIGNLTNDLGNLDVRVSPGASGGEATLEIQSITRARGATVQFTLENERAHIELGSVQLTNGLLPWAVIGSSTSNVRDLATAGPTGVGALGAVQPYVNDIHSATGTDNVQLLTDAMLTSNRDVNALRFDTFGDSVDLNLGGHRLTVESGAILASNFGLEIHNGQLTSGTNELILHHGFNPRIGANIVDNGSLPLAVTYSGGEFRVTGVNTYAGGTYVSANALLRVEGTESLPVDGDVTLSSGKLILGNSPTGTWKIGRLRLVGDGVEPASGATTAIEAQEYLLERGIIDVPIAGAGQLTKRSEGRVQLNNVSPQYTGQIVIEQGVLAANGNQTLGGGTADEAHATIVKRGGILDVFGPQANEFLILDGGDLVVASSSELATWSGPINVRDDSRIFTRAERSSYRIQGAITGTGDLTVGGPFGGVLLLNSSLSAYQGNLHITGGGVHLAGINTGYNGQITVDAANFTIEQSRSLGNAVVTILEAGQFTVGPNIGGNLVVQGGTLAFGEGPITLQGKLRFEGESLIDSSGVGLNIYSAARSAIISSETWFAEGSRLKKFGRGDVSFQGTTHLEGTAELVAFDGRLDLRGNVIADATETVLNLVGNAATFNASLHVPTGNSFALLANGEPVDLLLDAPGSTLTGGGVIAGNVVNSGLVSPGASPGRLRISGNYTQNANGTLAIDIEGDDNSNPLNLQFDLLEITGNANLSGTLAVDLEGYTPLQGDQFTIVDANTLSGAFSNAPNGQRLDTVDEDFSFIVNYNAGAGTVTLSSFALLADYNLNGKVDAADYTVWRNSLNQAGPNLIADGNRDGTVTQLDFAFWKSHYGESLCSGAGADAANLANVPEPTGAFLAGVALAGLLRQRRRLGLRKSTAKCRFARSFRICWVPRRPTNNYASVDAFPPVANVPIAGGQFLDASELIIFSPQSILIEPPTGVRRGKFSVSSNDGGGAGSRRSG